MKITKGKMKISGENGHKRSSSGEIRSRNGEVINGRYRASIPSSGNRRQACPRGDENPYREMPGGIYRTLSPGFRFGSKAERRKGTRLDSPDGESPGRGRQRMPGS